MGTVIVAAIVLANLVVVGRMAYRGWQDRRQEDRWMAEWQECQQWHRHGGHPTRQGLWVIEGKEEDRA